jgi:hypothetical protein
MRVKHAVNEKLATHRGRTLYERRKAMIDRVRAARSRAGLRSVRLPRPPDVRIGRLDRVLREALPHLDDADTTRDASP